MDFVSDQLFDGSRLRVLVIVDNHTRESPALEVSQRIRGLDVIAVLARITRTQRYPQHIQAENGPEFFSTDVDRWAYWDHVQLNFSRPGKPADNALVEAFDSRFRQECLNKQWLRSLDGARGKIEAWRQEHNARRPHSALGYRSPEEIIGDSEDSKTAAA